MTAWTKGFWIPKTLPSIVLLTLRENQRELYGRNRVYAAVQLMSWLAQHQVVSCRGTEHALVEMEPEWVKYSPSTVCMLTHAWPPHALVRACERVGLIETDRTSRRVERIRIRPDIWSKMVQPKQFELQEH